MSIALSWLKDLKDMVMNGLYISLVCLLICNIPALTSAARALLDRAGSVSAIEVAGVKIGFDQGTVFSQLENLHDLSAEDKNHVLQIVQGLEPDEFERLMYVGELANLCEYQHPTTEMRRMVATDYQLNAKNLTVVDDSKSQDLVSKITDQIKRDGGPSEIGFPRACYTMDLTDTGRNAKTALIKTLSAAFNPRVASK
jgi:hypothetical protein